MTPDRASWRVTAATVASGILALVVMWLIVVGWLLLQPTG